MRPAKVVSLGDEIMPATDLDRTDVYTFLPENIGHSRGLDWIPSGGACTVTFNESRVSKVSDLC